MLSELPQGFSMALAQNANAFDHYAALSEEEKNRMIGRAKAVKSKVEMKQLVRELDR